MIKIMIDSSADCRNESLYDYFVPITVDIGGKTYRDGIDLEADAFYQLLTSNEEFPHTAQPSPDEFVKVFEQVRDAGDELIYFSLSSGLSGTYQGALIAKEIVDYDGIYVIDSRSATHAIELMAEYAGKLIAEGLPAKQIVEKCEELKPHVRIYAGLDTLEYLKKGGRIGKAAALVGSLANIKPIITVTTEGEIDAAGKALGFGRAVQTIVDKMQKTEVNTDFPVNLLYTYGEANCEKLGAELKVKGFNVGERKQVGPTIGTHIGPGIFGVYFVEK
ncbi:MAG: DegV family protein [Clostridia bacterium]|nr:DegV family protein [Clostridia bacterium]